MFKYLNTVLATLLMLFMQTNVMANNLPNRLVSPEWLNTQIEKKHLLIIDIRSNNEYAEGHIPGAINLAIIDTFGPDPRTDLVKPASQIRKLFSQHGINFNQNILVYDNGKLIDSARLIWILEANGVSKVSMLNGGFPNWIESKFRITNNPSYAEKSLFIPAINPDRIATKLATRLAINNNNTTIVDARTPAEFFGIISKSARKGHIPGAINIPWDLSYNRMDNGSFIIKNRAELDELFKPIDKNKKAITYCNKGKQSALTHFIMRELGYNVSAYDGSWFEWGNDHTLPIQQTAARKSK